MLNRLPILLASRLKQELPILLALSPPSPWIPRVFISYNPFSFTRNSINGTTESSAFFSESSTSTCLTFIHRSSSTCRLSSAEETRTDVQSKEEKEKKKGKKRKQRVKTPGSFANWNFQFSPNFLDLLAPPPLPSSVYKRSPGNGGQRCSFGLAGSSPSNLRLAPSLLRPLHHLAPTLRPSTAATWLRLAENSSGHREKRIGRAWTRITSSFSPFFPTAATDFSPLRLCSSVRNRVPRDSLSTVCVHHTFASRLPRIRVSPDMRPRSPWAVPFRVHSVYLWGWGSEKTIFVKESLLELRKLLSLHKGLNQEFENYCLK